VVHVDQPAAELTLAKCRWRMAQFIGEEVARLLANRNEFQFQDPDTAEVRTLSPADLCILVRRRASAGPVEEKLRSLGIPYTFYKKTGIYQAPEALHTSLLLGALANPDAAQALHPALLSRFFGRTPRELAERPAEVEQATREHFERWRELCRERRWARLFHALLEDTGLAFREAGQPDGDRRLANFRQLFHDLVGLAEREALDVVGLREQLDLRRRRSVAVDSEEDLHHLDTEAPKVTIMTMHASKGLQFPIVFVADGFSALGRVSGNMIRYHGAEGRVTELKTSQGFLGEAQASQEAADETRRLFYVALTRARFKVYVPFGWKETKSGADPLTPLLTPAFAPFWDRQEEPQNDQMVCHLDCRGEIVGTGYPAPPIDGALDAIPVPPEPPPGWDEISEALAELRLPPPLGRWQRQVDSYSSLAHDHSGRNQMKFGDSEHEEAADDWTAPLAVDTLVPPGASAGSALHEILELADFATVSRYDDPGRLLATEDGFAALVDQSMARNGLVNQERGPTASTRLELAGMVWRALTTPLTAGGFRLGDVPPEDRQTELEFHLSEGEELLGFDAGIPPDRRGLLNGFVDLLYRWQGRYFIVDWKSNALAGGYAPAEILASMEEHEYTLQYRIYALALAAWLGRCLPDFSPDRHLGGVYYLYVRGLNGADASAGVFHQPLDGACLEEYRQEVLDRLARRS
jgi:exodeoxyribonuclease V beta subunit